MFGLEGCAWESGRQEVSPLLADFEIIISWLSQDSNQQVDWYLGYIADINVIYSYKEEYCLDLEVVVKRNQEEQLKFVSNEVEDQHKHCLDGQNKMIAN